MFDEATENAIWMFLEELMEAIRDEKLTFFEGCEVIVAPAGAPPEYITVRVDDIYDENVLWRGIPPTLNIGDIVVVWENPISHRREILGAGGAGGVGLLHDLLSATHGDTTPGAVVQGDLIVGDGVPSWANLAIGTPDQFLTVNAAGTDPVWASNLRQILELEFNDAALLTIAAGTVTRTQVYHVIAAQVGVADDLDNVLGGVEGDELVIRCDAGDTITVRHNQGGAGDFWLAGGANIALDNEDHLRCICDANGRWCDQSGGAGGALAVHDHSGILQGGQDLHDIQELEFAGITNLTIVAGAVTRTQVYHAIIPAGGVADDLDTINGGVEGDLLIIRRADAQPAVTVKHNVGNIWILSNQDVLLDDVDDHLALIYDGGYWCDMGGAGAGGGSLDDAYNVGRIIVADAGTVVIQDIGGLSVDSLIESTRTGAAPAAQHTVVDGAGNAVTEVLRLIHNLNVGFGAAGMGARILFRLVDDEGDIEDAAIIDAVWTDPDSDSLDSYLAFRPIVAGVETEIGRFDGAGLLMAAAKCVTLPDDAWIGLGAAAGRIVFDSTPTPDEIVVNAANVGIGGSPGAGNHLYVVDAAVNTTVTYAGIYATHTKTAGATDENDSFYAIYGAIALNDADSTVGSIFGVNALALLTDGTIGTVGANRNLSGNLGSAQIDGGTINGALYGVRGLADCNAGTITGAVYGIYSNVDIEAAMTSVGGSVYGVYVIVDDDESVAGTVYMLYLLEQSGIDYGIYQSGTADSAFGGNILPTGNKAKNLGAAANRWNTLYIGTSTAAGTSRLVDSKKDCPVCKRKMKRGTGSLLVLGEDRDYILAHCIYCGATAMEEVKHLPEERLAGRQSPPKVEFVGFHVFEMSSNSRQVRADFRYTDDVVERSTGPDGEVFESRKLGITNATYLGETEIEDFMNMTAKQRKAFLLELGEREWYALEDVRLIQEHVGELQGQLDILTVKLAGKDLN